MPAPYLRIYELSELIGPPGRQDNKITSVVLDQVDFDTLCDDIAATGIMPPKQLDACRKGRSIPLVGKGRKTAFIFERYGVTTYVMGVIVRGAGTTVLNNLIQKILDDNLPPERN